MFLQRAQFNNIIRHLEKKMVFIVGPRQVGKTRLAREIAKRYNNPLYLSYDNPEHRTIINNMSWDNTVDLLILDEIHKMQRGDNEESSWKNYIKGVYDTKPDTMHILVTGSARLDAYKSVGDSMAGRFFVHHLLPFSLSELEGTQYAGDMPRLIERGGFPEPFLSDSLDDVRVWRRLYADSLLRQDVLDFKDVDNWRAMRDVFEILQYKVGSPLSYNNIARDVGIAPNTVKRYITIFEALYMVFTIKPYTKKITRSILKEPKVYFYDSGLVRNGNGAILENIVAVSLMKHIYEMQDVHGYDARLAFLKMRSGHEVDFAIVQDNELSEIIEVKSGDSAVSKSLAYFANKYNIRASQLVYNINVERRSGEYIMVRDMSKYLARL